MKNAFILTIFLALLPSCSWWQGVKESPLIQAKFSDAVDCAANVVSRHIPDVVPAVGRIIVGAGDLQGELLRLITDTAVDLATSLGDQLTANNRASDAVACAVYQYTLDRQEDMVAGSLSANLIEATGRAESWLRTNEVEFK